MQSESQDNNLPQLPAQAPGTRARLIREKIKQSEIDELNNLYDRFRRSALESAKIAIELGEKLTSAQKRMRPGKWEKWVAKNLSYSLRTAQRFMRAHARKEELALGGDPGKFMAELWGNEPKELEGGKGVKKGGGDVDVASDDEQGGNDEEDLSQHGGPGFDPGFFSHKGKPALDGFKKLVGTLDREFFDSEEISLEAKLSFITELIVWLEARREVFAARLERKEPRKE